MSPNTWKASLNVSEHDASSDCVFKLSGFGGARGGQNADVIQGKNLSTDMYVNNCHAKRGLLNVHHDLRGAKVTKVTIEEGPSWQLDLRFEVQGHVETIDRRGGK